MAGWLAGCIIRLAACAGAYLGSAARGREGEDLRGGPMQLDASRGHSLIITRCRLLSLN